MLNIIKSDFYKFTRSKTFYVMIIITAFFGLLTIIGTYFALKNGDGEGPTILLQNARQILFSAMNSNMNIMLIAVMSSIFVAREYSSGIIKDTVSSGTQRRNIFLSKFLIASLFAIILTLINVFIQGSFGSIMLGYGQAFNLQEFLLITKTFFSASFILVSCTALFVMLATAFKSLGASLATNIGIIMFGGLFFYLVSLIHTVLKDISDYWIADTLDAVINNGLMNVYSFTPLLIASFYLVGSLLIGIMVFNKQDIK